MPIVGRVRLQKQDATNYRHSGIFKPRRFSERSGLFESHCPLCCGHCHCHRRGQHQTPLPCTQMHHPPINQVLHKTSALSLQCDVTADVIARHRRSLDAKKHRCCLKHFLLSSCKNLVQSVDAKSALNVSLLTRTSVFRAGITPGWRCCRCARDCVALCYSEATSGANKS